MKKVCSKCKIEKEIQEFHKNNGGKYGVRSVCKNCQNKETSKWAKNNPEKQKERCKKWLQKENNKENIKNWVKRYDHIKNKNRVKDDYLFCRTLLSTLKIRSKKKNLDFNLDTDYLISLVNPMICSKTGVKLVRGNDGVQIKGHYLPNLLSIDKIIPSLGYTKGNVQIVCWWYNVSKQYWTEEEVIIYAKKLIKNEKKNKKI